MTISSIAPRPSLVAARSIAKALSPAERHIDTSIAAGAHLVASIAQGRLDAGVAAETGTDALRTAIGALSALGQARELTVTCHQHLTLVRDNLRFAPRDVGCEIGKLTSSDEVGSVVAA